MKKETKKGVKIEHSHLVQLHTHSKTTWRGHEWSMIDVSVKVDSFFLAKKRGQSRFELVPCIEDVKTKKLYDASS